VPSPALAARIDWKRDQYTPDLRRRTQPILINCKREGLVKPEMMNDWMQKSNVVLRSGGLDESPHFYKRLPEVLAAHGNTIRILHKLTPLGVAMAGANESIPTRIEPRINR